MNDQIADPVSLTTEAALELEELKQKVRHDTPALHALLAFLRTPAQAYGGQASVSMLADVRSYTLLRDAASAPKTGDFAEFRKWMGKYIDGLEKGVERGDTKTIDLAKSFCLALNESMLSRQWRDLYERRERSDSRYMSDGAV